MSTVITYKLHVSTGRRCQTPDCCAPARSLGKCPHCDRHVWFHLPWSWGWHKTPRCHPRSPPGWVSSGRHPERQHQRKGGQHVAAASPGPELLRAPGPGMRQPRFHPGSLCLCDGIAVTFPGRQESPKMDTLQIWKAPTPKASKAWKIVWLSAPIWYSFPPKALFTVWSSTWIKGFHIQF